MELCVAQPCTKKGFSVVNIVGLAIGMAAALLILTYVAFEYSYDDMHSRQDRIFRVEARFYENGELTDDWASSSAGYATAMKQNMSAVEDYTRVGSQYYPEQVEIQRTAISGDRYRLCGS